MRREHLLRGLYSGRIILPVCITFDHSWSAGVLLVGVGEPLELRLIELGQEARVHRGQLHGLVREGSVEIAHIHWVFLQNDGI